MNSTGLRRFTQPAPPAPEPVERCELCGVALDSRHGHLVEVEKRSLACACRACYLLFTRDGAAGGRYRAVPDRYAHDSAHPLADADWEELQIPVTTAFLFTNTALGRTVACYPSPAGATECLLDLAAWDRLTGVYPLLGAVAPDVEAVFVTRTDEGLATYVVPIDACYGLVGAVRMRWSGLDGGAEVRQTLAAFLADLKARSRPLAASRPSDGEV
jgi:hypothetical protein